MTVSASLRRGRGVLALPGGRLRDRSPHGGARGAEPPRRGEGGRGAGAGDLHRAGRRPLRARRGAGRGRPRPAHSRRRAGQPRRARSRAAARLPAEEAWPRVRAYFRDNFRYSLYRPAPDGEVSALEDFLRRSRAGHCEYFATATVLLLRAAGVPARYATGYSVQEWSPLERTGWCGRATPTPGRWPGWTAPGATWTPRRRAGPRWRASGPRCGSPVRISAPGGARLRPMALRRARGGASRLARLAAHPADASSSSGGSSSVAAQRRAGAPRRGGDAARVSGERTRSSTRWSGGSPRWAWAGGPPSRRRLARSGRRAAAGRADRGRQLERLRRPALPLSIRSRGAPRGRSREAPRGCPRLAGRGRRRRVARGAASRDRKQSRGGPHPLEEVVQPEVLVGAVLPVVRVRVGDTRVGSRRMSVKAKSGTLPPSVGSRTARSPAMRPLHGGDDLPAHGRSSGVFAGS